MTNMTGASAHLETDLWRWLLFESSFSRRRAREIILQGVQSNALSLFWQAGAAILSQQLELSSSEIENITRAKADWASIQRKFEEERRRGIRTIRLNDSSYPASLMRFLPTGQRPMLLFIYGEPVLLDMPLVLPIAETPPDAAAESWALDTLADLAGEGAMPLFIARSGFEARIVKTFLETAIPFVLIIPQGIAAYTPPAILQQALKNGTALLISPFQPDWRPVDSEPNPLLPHAVNFARALAQAHLCITSPAPESYAGQPCFCKPDISAAEHCPDVYGGPEALFLRLAESLAPTGSIQTSSPPPSEPAPAPVSSEKILETLARGGHIPEALAARLKKRSS